MGIIKAVMLIKCVQIKKYYKLQQQNESSKPRNE